jgi:hypothetical protein
MGAVSSGLQWEGLFRAWRSAGRRGGIPAAASAARRRGSLAAEASGSGLDAPGRSAACSDANVDLSKTFIDTFVKPAKKQAKPN